MKSRKSPRKKGYDYTLSGRYFVTICTKDRKHFFGDAVDDTMILNQLGKYVTEHRKHIPDHYPFVICDEFICMPNHIHGILVIGDNTFNRDVGTQFIASHNVRGRNVARTYKNMSLQDGIQPKSGSLGSIIRGFKIGITKYARQIDMPFAWQGRYHDRIIRNNHEYERIKYYIQTNPENWSEDRFFNT